MSKMRFIQTPTLYERKGYITHLKGNEVLTILKTKLNMQPIYGNYKGDLTKERLCPYCQEEDDITEHLITCKVFETSITKELLVGSENVELWRQVAELVKFNIENRGH